MILVININKFTGFFIRGSTSGVTRGFWRAPRALAIDDIDCQLRLAHQRRMSRFARHSLCFFSAAVAIACGDSDARIIVLDPAADEASASAPVYGVFTSVETPENEATYLGLTTTLAGEAALDTASALEAPASSRFYAPRDGGFFAIGSNDDFSITRYAVDDDRRILETGRMSMAAIGVTRLQNRVVFVSATKAYYIDESAAQLVVWNPDAMTIERTIALPEALGEGYLGYSTDLPFGRFPLVDDRLFIPVGWYNFETGVARELTGLAVIDTNTDSVISYSETERCPGATELAFDDNGDVYFGTGVNYPFYAHAADPARRAAARPACILRIRAGEQVFDPDYLASLASMTGGLQGMGLTDAATPGSAYVQVIDEAVLPWSAVGDEDTFWETPAWSWWKVDLRSGEAALDPALPASAPYMTSYEVDGRRYISRQMGDNQSRLYELAADGAHRPSVTLVGSIRGVARIR